MNNESFCSQHEEKERAFKEQLSHLAALLPTLQVRALPVVSLPVCLSDSVYLIQSFLLQVHLVTCSAFLSSANKFEFLDMGYVSRLFFPSGNSHLKSYMVIGRSGKVHKVYVLCCRN